MKHILRLKNLFRFSCCIIVFLSIQSHGWGQMIITNTTPVVQNFNGMGTAASATLPTGFRIGTDYTSGTTATTQAFGTTGTGAVASNSSGATVNWANGVTGSSTDRALGFLNSGSFTSPKSIMMEIQNNGTSNITSLTVAFDYEKYRTGTRAFGWTFFHGSTTTAATANASGDQDYAGDGANAAVNPATTISKSFTLSGLSIAPSSKYYLRWTFTGVGGSTNGQGIGIDNVSLTAAFQAAATPTITGAASTAVFTTTYGTASTAQNFVVSGSNLTANLIATAPTGFEVSNDGISYATTATFTQSGGNASGTLRIRLRANAAVTGNYNSKSIVLSSTGAASANITTPVSGNSVSAKGLTITGITGTNKVYDRTTTASFSGTAVYSGLVNGESFGTTGTPVASFITAAAGNARTVNVTGYTAPSTNYSIAQPVLSANITQKSVSVSGITIDNKAYDGTTTAIINIGSASINGVIAPDNVTIDSTAATADFISAAAGNGINVTVTGLTIAGTDSGNYSLSGQPTGLSADINKADQSIIFGVLAQKQDTDPAFDLTAIANSGLTVTYLSSDTNVATVSGNTVTIIAAGTTTITASQAGDANYNAAASIPQTLTVTSTSKLDQAITFDDLPAVNYGDSSFVLTATADSGLNVSYISSNPAAATVSGNTVTIVGPGETTITASQAGDETYNPAVDVLQTLTVNTKALTVTGAIAASKEYDATTLASISGAVLAGVVGADDVIVSGNGNFDDANTGIEKTVTASLVLGGADNFKYSIIQPSGLTASINAKAVSISGLSVITKNYDGNTDAVLTGTATVDGILPADNANVTLDASLATADFDNENVGTGKNVIVNGYTLTGTAASNYVLAQPLLTGEIQPKSLTLTGITVDDKTYDGNTTTVTNGIPALNGIVGTEDVTLDGTAATAFDTATAANNKAILITGLSLTGTAVANYVLDTTGITASVNPALLTYTADPAARVYGVANPAFTGSIDGFVNGEDLTATTGTMVFTSPAVNLSAPGSYAINGSGLSAVNYVFDQAVSNSTALTITKADQTITFGTLANKTTADTPFALTGTSTSGLSLVYDSSNTAVATVSGSTVTIIGAGTTTITANQPGNANYNAATPVPQTLTVTAAPVSIFANAITGTNPNTSNPYTAGQTSSANITVSGIRRGAGITGTNANDRYNANSWDTPAFDTTAYFEFTLTPNSGFKIDFANFVYTGQASGTGPTSFSLRSSADGFASSIGTPVVSGATINLSAAAYQNITTPITFRFYAYGASAAGGTFSINSFVFNGNVAASAVPSVTALPTAVTALDYYTNAGPSASQAIDISGASLTPVSGNLTANATANFEVSSDNITFSNTAQISYTGGTLTSIPFYIRTVSGLDVGTYNGTVTISGGNASDVVVNVQGIVRVPFSIPYANNFRTQQAVDDAVGQAFVINNSTFNPTGYEQISLNGYIETPVIDFTQETDIQVLFDGATFGGNTGQTLQLQISTDGGANYLPLQTVTYISNAFVTTTVDIDLTAYPSATGKLRIQMTAGTNTTRFRDLVILDYTIWNGTTWSNGTPNELKIASIEGNYTESGILTARKLTVNSGNVTFFSGSAMSLTDQLNVAGGNLLFESNANLLQSNGAANNGLVSFERTASMRRLDYVYWSSPVLSQLLIDFSPATLSNRFYELTEASNSFLAVDPTITTFAAGKGYSVRAPNNFPNTPQTFTGIFAGTPRNGSVSVPVTAVGLGYNLIGNPYPSPINAASFLATNPTVGTLYFWTHTNQDAVSGANYATFNSTGAASIEGGEIPNGIIQTGQGFMINVPSATTTVSFLNSMRADNHQNQFFRTSGTGVSDKNRIWLNLSNASIPLNQILIGYVEGATNNFDIEFDGKLLETQNSILYNLLDNSEYTIQGKALPFVNTDIVPLGFKAVEAGNYTISLDHADGLFSEDQDIFIKDNLTGSLHNIKLGNYTFTSGAGTFNNRFEVVYQNAPLGIEPAAFDSDNVIIYKQNGVLNINSGSHTMQSLKVYDIRGRLIYEKQQINTASFSIDALKALQEVLILEITDDSNKTLHKKVIY